MVETRTPSPPGRARAAADGAVRVYGAAARAVLRVAQIASLFAAGGALVLVLGVGVLTEWDPWTVVPLAGLAALPVLVLWFYRRALQDAVSLPQRAWATGRAVAPGMLSGEARRALVTPGGIRRAGALTAALVLRRSATALRGVLPGAGRLASLPYHLLSLACVPVAAWMWLLGLLALAAGILG